jgi:hypothetical protein
MLSACGVRRAGLSRTRTRGSFDASSRNASRDPSVDPPSMASTSNVPEKR